MTLSLFLCDVSGNISVPDCSRDMTLLLFLRDVSRNTSVGVVTRIRNGLKMDEFVRSK